MLRGHTLTTAARDFVRDVDYREPTRSAYLRTLRAFDRRVQSRRPDTRLIEITPEDIVDFVHMKDDGTRRADRSIKQYLNVVWLFFDWAASTEIALVATNPASRLRAQRRKERRSPQDVGRKVWLGETRAQTLIATTRGDGTDPVRRRDAMVLSLYLYTGLRLSELLRLRWRDVDFATGPNGVLHVLGKGRKVAQVALNRAARRTLFEWRSEFVAGVGTEDIDDLPLIPKSHGVPLGPIGQPGLPRRYVLLWRKPMISPARVRDMIAERAAEAGIGHVAPHDLRRSFAGILRDRGVELEDIRRAMRHSRTSTTEIYLEAKPELVSALDDLDFG